MKHKTIYFLWLTIVILSVSTAVRAADSPKKGWSEWEGLSDGVAVRYKQVNKDTWTWSFHNLSDSETITYMAFDYIDTKGTHKDILPYSLKPRQYFGGWFAFTASSRPQISITKIQRKKK